MRGVTNRVFSTGGYVAVFFTFLLVRWCPFLRARIVSTCLPQYPLHIEAAASAGRKGAVAAAFSTLYAFVTAIRDEQNRCLSKRTWEQAPITINGTTYMFYSRNLLLVAILGVTSVSYRAHSLKCTILSPGWRRPPAQKCAA